MKMMTRQLLALLLSLCMLLGGVAASAEEEIEKELLKKKQGVPAAEVVEEVPGEIVVDAPAGNLAVGDPTYYPEGGEGYSEENEEENEEEGAGATATVEDDTLIVEAEDVEEGGVSVGTVVDGEYSDIYVTIGDEPLDTEDAFDDQGEPVVDEVDVSLGDVTGEDYGIDVSAYDYDDEADIDVTVIAGDVTANGEDDATGVEVYDYNADVDITTGNVTVGSDEGKAAGLDVTAEGESNVDIEVLGDVLAVGGSDAVGIDVTSEGENQVNIAVDGDVVIVGEEEAVGIDVTADGGSKVRIVVDGDVATGGESGAGIRVQGIEPEGETEEAPVNVVVTGTISGTDAAIQVAENMAESIGVTAWAVEENENGELAQVYDDQGEVNEEASGLLERAIQYIVRVAEEFKNRLSVSTGKTVTVGDETYETAAEDEEVTVQVTLDSDEVLRGIYYNDDEGTEAEYTPDGGNFLIKMLRGGAMLLGLDIDKIEPAPRPQPISYDVGDDDSEHHHHSSSGSVTSRTEFVYEPVGTNVPVHSVIAADDQTVQRVAQSVSDALNGGYRYVDIQNKEVVMDGVEIARFDTLSLEDRMLVMMAAMGLTDTAGDFRSSMSDAARALAADIDTRVAAMTDSQRAARMDEVNVFFPPRLVTVNGVTYEGVGIVLIINANGNKSYERYTFYDANGVWKLHLIEEGKYVTVD